VDQSTEDVAAAQPAHVRPVPRLGTLRRHRRGMGQTAVRTATVVMLDVAPQDANKLLATDDRQLIEALPADRADPAFGVGVGIGRPNGRADDLTADRAPDIIEHPGDLGVSVADQELPRRNLIAKVDQHIASLLGNPHARGMVGDATRMHPPAAKFDEEQHMQPAQPDSINREEVARDDPGACWRRNDRQLVEMRRGAGSRPWARSTRRIELADTRTPRRRISPWMRW
jgi:hypothetical protein